MNRETQNGLLALNKLRNHRFDRILVLARNVHISTGRLPHVLLRLNERRKTHVVADVHFSAKHDSDPLLDQLIDRFLVERFAGVRNR